MSDLHFHSHHISDGDTQTHTLSQMASCVTPRHKCAIGDFGKIASSSEHCEVCLILFFVSAIVQTHLRRIPDTLRRWTRSRSTCDPETLLLPRLPHHRHRSLPRWRVRGVAGRLSGPWVDSADRWAGVRGVCGGVCCGPRRSAAPGCCSAPWSPWCGWARRWPRRHLVEGEKNRQVLFI